MLAADCLLLAPLYAAGEPPIEGVSSESLAETIRGLHPELQVAVADNLDQLTVLVQEQSRSGDLVLAMGAGDVNSLWRRLTAENTTPERLSKLAA